MDWVLVRQGQTPYGESALCAKRGESLNIDPQYLNTDKGCYFIPRRLKGLRIKSKENCIALCPQSYHELVDNYPDEDIPMTELPFHGSLPSRMHTQY